MLYFWQISNFQPQQKRRSIQTNTADIHVVNEIPSIDSLQIGIGR